MKQLISPSLGNISCQTKHTPVEFSLPSEIAKDPCQMGWDPILTTWTRIQNYVTFPKLVLAVPVLLDPSQWKGQKRGKFSVISSLTPLFQM